RPVHGPGRNDRRHRDVAAPIKRRIRWSGDTRPTPEWVVRLMRLQLFRPYPCSITRLAAVGSCIGMIVVASSLFTAVYSSLTRYSSIPASPPAGNGEGG